MSLTRRGFGVATGALALLGGGILLYRRLGGHWYAPTPYDDLLHQIADRAPAAALGKAAIKTMPGFSTETVAARLRQPGFELAERARKDAVAGRLTEADGWIVPETVAFYSALAAQFA
jgi:hypothetical protein